MSADFLYRSSLTVGAVLGGAGASIVLIESVRRRSLLDSDLGKKWGAWCGLALMWLIALTSMAALSAVLGAVGIIIAREYSRLARLGRVDQIATMAMPIVGVAAMIVGHFELVLIALIAVGTLPTLFTGDTARGPGRVGAILTGFMFTTVPIVSLWGLATTRRDLFLTLLFAVALSDVTAYVVGSTVGRRPLSAALSPNKTRAGALGNLIGAAIGVTIGALVSPLGTAEAAALIAIAALGSLWGDLFESLFKRHAGVKDTGRLLPGFGGLLDRFDSMVICAPMTWLIFSVAGVL